MPGCRLRAALHLPYERMKVTDVKEIGEEVVDCGSVEGGWVGYCVDRSIHGLQVYPNGDSYVGSMGKWRAWGSL